MRAIVDALSPSHPARRIVVMKSAQVGFTEGGNCWIGYVIHHAPGPMLAVQPTVELAKRFSRQRIEPLIAESPVLLERVKPARSRDAGNTVLSKEFPAGLLIITGANSAVGLRSMPARYLFLDEVDAYPPSADEEGDPVALAEARTRTFSWRSKVLLGSTPTIHGLSRIEREYEAADQRRYFVPCPHCCEMQWLKFEHLRWDKGKPETAHYECTSCGGRIEEHHKTAMLEAGEWRPTVEAQDPGTIGFHISALYSPVGWLSWENIARLWEAATTDEAKRSFKNSVLGETWVETGEAPDWQRLYERREAWQIGTVPSGGLFLTAGADVQKDRIEVDVWAWGRGLESWLVDHIVIEGGPERAEAWHREARDRHRVRGARRLCLGSQGWSRPGRADQGYRRLQSRGAGRRSDARRCHGRRQEAAPWRAAVDDRGLDLQERDISLPASVGADRRGNGRGCEIPRGLRAPAARRRSGMGKAARRRATGDGQNQARLQPSRMAEAARAQ
jgi:phage terminase large subunit GpA-like protein